MEYLNKVYDFVKTIDIKWIFPKDLNYCITMAGYYITVFSLISQISSKQAEADRNTNIANITDDYMYVEDISNDILWNCRTESPYKYYYRLAFGVLLASLLIAYVFTTVWSLCDGKFSHWIEFISSITLKVSFVFLLTTYDVSLWDCFNGPSDVEYDAETGKVNLKFRNSTIKYQLIGSIISTLLFLLCIILNLIHNCKRRGSNCSTKITDLIISCNKCCEANGCLPTEEAKEKEKQRENIIKFVEYAKDLKKSKVQM